MLFTTYALIARKWQPAAAGTPVTAAFVVVGAAAAACWFLMMSAQKKRQTVHGRSKEQHKVVLYANSMCR